MDVNEILKQLRAERDHLDHAILALERLVMGSRKRQPAREDLLEEDVRPGQDLESSPNSPLSN